MSRNNSYKTICFTGLCLVVLFAEAQQKTIVKAKVDRTNILIGEPILLTLEANVPENEPIRFFYLDTIPHFEFLDRPKIDTINTSEGTILKQAIRITSFDSGHWVIPSFILRDNITTDSIAIDVGFSPFNKDQAYHDIKDIIEVNPEKEKDTWWTWYAIGGGAVLLLLLLIYLLRKKKAVVKAPPGPVDPYVEAMKQLEKLQHEAIEKKQYYSRLVDIFRVYVLNRKGIHSLQNTTGDLVMQLKIINMSKEQFDNLSQALRLSDYVKFAKYVPSEDETKNAFITIKKSIEDIEHIK